MTVQICSINLNLILNHFAGDEDILREVVKSFLLSAPKLITEIETSIKDKSARNLEISAHTLKGSVSHFFIKDLHEVLSELESSGRKNQFAEVQEKFESAKIKLNSLCKDLQALLLEKKAG